MNFEGTYVAMVTPLNNDGSVNEDGFRSNINYPSCSKRFGFFCLGGI